MWKLALLAIAGCYVDVRPGISAPVGHDHGGEGTDFGVAFGGEHAEETFRVGGGIVSGVRIADNNGYVPIGVDGHLATLLAPGQPWLFVAHASVGYAHGISNGPSGIFNSAFAGIGIGRTVEQDDSKLPRSHIAIGPTATWFRADSGNSYWLLGAALELSVGFLNR